MSFLDRESFLQAIRNATWVPAPKDDEEAKKCECPIYSSEMNWDESTRTCKVTSLTINEMTPLTMVEVMLENQAEEVATYMFPKGSDPSPT